MTAPGFDFDAPLPEMSHIPAYQSWEPAARHYIDLSPEERKLYGMDADV